MTDDPAKRRFFVILALRWSGVLLAVFGLAIIYHKVDLPIEAGYAIFLVGLVDALIMPTVFARLWKSRA